MLLSGSVLYSFGVVGRPRSCRWSVMVCVDFCFLVCGSLGGLGYAAVDSL